MIDTSLNQPSSLSISCVYYDTDEEVFLKTLNSLIESVKHAINSGMLNRYEIYLINNADNQSPFWAMEAKLSVLSNSIKIQSGHGNIGYGAGNNLAINCTKCKYHLILNPDVEITINSITEGIKYLEMHQDVGVIAPDATNQFGEIEYIAKRKPSPFIIFLRGLNSSRLNNIFRKMLDHYLYKDRIPAEAPFDIELASGCFMLCRTLALKKVNGFSDVFFLYFEDFDLSEKIWRHFKIRHLPSMKIQHIGGNTRGKNIKHRYLFIKSAVIYFSRH